MSEKDGRFVQAKVKVADLKKGMVIRAYSRFSDRYTAMDDPTCEFVMHNFKGTRSVIIRDGKKVSINVKYVKPGDTLMGIYDFPPNLQRITIVTKDLVGALEKRGMLEFVTVQPKLIRNKARKDLKELVQIVEQTVNSKKKPLKRSPAKGKTPSARIANELIDSVQQSIPIRSETSSSIEDEMENARRGKLGVKAIEESVNQVMANQSIDAMLAISSMINSQQTYDHCVDVGVIFQSVYLKIQKKRKKKSVFKNESQVMLAAFLHDFGKSVVPHEILDSREHFDKNSRAMQIIRSHPEHGARQLESLDMPKAIVDMARYHHVKMDNDMLTSYPQIVDYKKVGFESRLLAVIDIYQALVGTRSYQKSWSPPATMRYLEALAGVEVDQYAFDLFVREMGVYPKGSLVQLSDDSIGFVMNVPDENMDLNRPLVAVVRDSRGTDLTHHHLLDLHFEKDISIKQDVDRNDIFGDRAVDVFTHILLT
jgi:putative nucleotidyltransferase with HDIG domain